MKRLIVGVMIVAFSAGALLWVLVIVRLVQLIVDVAT